MTTDDISSALTSLTEAVESLTTKITGLEDVMENLGGYLDQNANETNKLAQINEALLKEG